MTLREPCGAIFTIGHSTRTVEHLIEMLHAFDIGLLLDIRTVPKSRHNPQFAKSELERTLPAAGIEYRHEPALGGLRHPRKDSPNAAWRNESFRGYADYMQTPEFGAALGGVVALSGTHRLAMMCAEGNPFRCHRSLVADALLARGIQACEIASTHSAKPHRMTPFAHIDGTRVTYPAEPNVSRGNDR